MEAKQQPQVYESSDVLPSFREQLNYGIADFGYSSIYLWVSAFMTIFFTDQIGISATSVSLLLLVVRIFDAVNDPIIGSIADRTQTKHGRYKPWIAIGGTIMCILIALLFAAQPTWPIGFRLAWMWFFYVLVTVASTCCGMPYNALNGIITSNAIGRAKLSGIRMVCASFGTNFTNLIAATMILFFSGTKQAENSARGYFGAVIFSIVLGLPFIIWTAVKCKERVQLPPVQIKMGNKVPFMTQLKCLLGNKCALCCVCGQFVAGFHGYGRMAIMAYYFTYYENNFSLYSITGLIGLFTSTCGAGILAPLLYKAFQHKGRAVSVGFGMAGVFFMLMFWFSARGVFFWVCYMLSSMCGTAATGLRSSCDGDNADFAEYKYGVRVDGFLSAFVSMAMKAGGAVGPAVLLSWLDHLGYVPNQIQSETVLNALNMGMSIIPGILCFIAAGIFALFYDMDSEKHMKIVRELEKRRNIYR